MSAVETTNLSKQFGAVRALDGVSITLEQGSAIGLVGPNGSGKSTLLRVLSALTPPTSGTARVCGADVRSEPRRVRDSIGYLPQALTLDAELTILENLRYYTGLRDDSWRDSEARALRLLDRMGLRENAGRVVRTLSLGTRRRAFLELLREAQEETSAAMVITTHNADEMADLCRTFVRLDAGRVAAV